MSFLIRTILIAILIVNAIGQPVDDDDEVSNEYSNLKRRLVKLLGEGDSASEDESSLEERYIGATAEGSCLPNILPDFKWSGPVLKVEKNIPSIQKCLDNCHKNKACVGFTYGKTDKSCTTFKSIHGAKIIKNSESGSCVNSRIKVPCTGSTSGKYSGVLSKTLKNIASSSACLNSCTQDEACFGWTYSPATKVCSLYTDLTKFTKGGSNVSGSCIAPLTRNQDG